MTLLTFFDSARINKSTVSVFSQMTNLSKPYKMLSHLVLFLALSLANGRLSGRRVVDRKKTRKLLADSGELINVVVGYTDTAFTEQASSTFTSFRSTY